MRLPPELLGTCMIAGMPCRVTCEDPAFRALLWSRYSECISDALPQVSVRVEVKQGALSERGASQTGAFARFGGREGILTVEGAGFRGEFNERSGEGWIAQPPDPSPLETFLTGICAGRLLRDDGFLLHAAALAIDGGACVYFGPSGSGKTTVAKLAGEGVITDEITAIRREGQGYRVSAFPWRGGRLTAPLTGLFQLRQAQTTAFVPLSAAETIRRLLPSVLFPRADAWEVSRFFEISEQLLTRIPCYEMRFTPDPSFWRAMPRARERPRHAGPGSPTRRAPQATGEVRRDPRGPEPELKACSDCDHDVEL